MVLSADDKQCGYLELRSAKGCFVIRTAMRLSFSFQASHHVSGPELYLWRILSLPTLGRLW